MPSSNPADFPPKLGKSLRIEGPGGFFGLWIGENAIYNTLGPASVFLILGIYVMSLMFTITSHPISDSALAWKAFVKWREARHKASLQRWMRSNVSQSSAVLWKKEEQTRETAETKRHRNLL